MSVWLLLLLLFFASLLSIERERERERSVFSSAATHPSLSRSSACPAPQPQLLTQSELGAAFADRSHERRASDRMCRHNRAHSVCLFHSDTRSVSITVSGVSAPLLEIHCLPLLLLLPSLLLLLPLMPLRHRDHLITTRLLPFDQREERDQRIGRRKTPQSVSRSLSV